MAQENKNQLRFSIEIKALKQQQFSAQLYFIVRPIPQLGMKTAYRSSPTIAIVNPRVQVSIGNVFKTYLFTADKPQLKQYLSGDLIIQLWHNDRIKKDVLLGITKVSLPLVLEQPFRKTKQSFVLVCQAWVPVDQVNPETNQPIKKIAALRAAVYLQDLGPVNLLKQKGFDVKNYINEEQIPMHDQLGQYQFNKNALPSQKYGGAGLDDQKRLELNQLEHQVVWELQSWKKAEQARTRLVLKQKQAEFWTSLAEQQKNSDIQKQKQFKKIEQSLTLTHNKLIAKMNDLIKRQQKLIVMEQELQSKINQISRQVFLKDEQIQRLKKRQKQQKTAVIKQKANIEIQLSKLRTQNAKLKIELEQATKKEDSGAIAIMKAQLSHKIVQIKTLRKELQNCMQIKEQFKSAYEKMKKQVIEKGAQIAETKDQLTGARHEISLLKKDISHLQQNLVRMKQQQFYNNNYGYATPSNDEEQAPMQFNSERQRLIFKRRQMLQAGNYTANDPLIKEIDKKIAALQ